MKVKEHSFVILIPGFPENETDSTCLPAHQHFVRSLKEMNPGLQIYVLSFQYPYHRNPYSIFESTVYPFGGRNKGGLKKLWLRWKLNNVLKKIHTETHITGILSFWYNECARVGKIFADRNDLKHFCWIRGQDAKKNNKYPAQLNLKPGELIALSDFLQEEFEKNHGIRPLFVIPSGIDHPKIDYQPQPRDIDIMAAGSLIPLKQHDVYLEILTVIKNNFPGLKAVLAGKGPELGKLQKLAINYQLADNVLFTGELPHGELMQMMQRVKLFLHTSSYEGFSAVCQEALSAGAAVISYCRAMKQDIPNWHIVQTRKQMEEKAIEILSNPNPSHQPVHPFTMEQTVKKIMNLYRERLHS